MMSYTTSTYFKIMLLFLFCAVVTYAQQSDITIQSAVVAAPDSITAGDTITVSYVIANIGAANADTSDTRIEIRNQADSVIVAALFPAPAIAAGDSTPVLTDSLVIPANTAAGTYTAYVILDSLNELDQSDTTNDYTSGAAFTVIVLQSDIVVQSPPEVSPDTVIAGQMVTLSYVIANIGAGDADTSDTRIEIRDQADSVIVVSLFPAPAIAAGDSSPVLTDSLMIPVNAAAGTYTAYVVLDSLNELNQSDTTNDYTAGAVFTVIVLQSDIVILSPPIVSPDTVIAGQMVTLSYVIANIGAGDADTSKTRIEIRDQADSVIVAALYPTPAIAAGDSSSVLSNSILIPVNSAGGIYTAYVILDSLNELNQSDTTNDYTAGVELPVEEFAVPVELTSFSAVSAGNTVTIRWNTATEVNNKGFELERKVLQASGNVTSEWMKVAFIAGRGTTTEPSAYTYSDKNLDPGNYLYRLKQTDYDGTFAYSESVNAIIEMPIKYDLSQNYPNPFNPSTTLKFSLVEESLVELRIYNILGQEVVSLANNVYEAGVHKIEFNAGNLSSGIYIAKINTVSRKNNHSFTKSMKMTLIK